jgi:copper chaperone
MTTSIIHVDGMSCEHCVKAVTTAVTALEGVSSVAVDLGAKTVTVEHDPNLTSVDSIQAAIEEQGYDIL